MSTKYRAKYLYTTAGSTLMYPDDIILMDGDKVYNSTRGLDFSVYDIELFKDTYLIPNETSNVVDPTTTEVATTYLKAKPSETEKQIFKIQEILDGMLTTYIKKNHDYGNSFDKSLDEEGLAAARIRMGDKWNRFKQLSKGEDALVKDESIKDTLLDLALYAVMTVNWYDSQKM